MKTNPSLLSILLLFIAACQQITKESANTKANEIDFEKEKAAIMEVIEGEDTGDSSMDMPGLSRETRIIEKHLNKF